MPGRTLHALRDLWVARGRTDEYVGTLVNAYIAAGGVATGVRAGEAYVDVGTLNGYREAIALLGGGRWKAPPARWSGSAGRPGAPPAVLHGPTTRRPA